MVYRHRVSIDAQFSGEKKPNMSRPKEQFYAIVSDQNTKTHVSQCYERGSLKNKKTTFGHRHNTDKLECAVPKKMSK